MVPPTEANHTNYHSKFVDCRERLENTTAKLRESELETAKALQQLRATQELLDTSRHDTSVAVKHAESSEESYSAVLLHLTGQLEVAKSERQAVVSRLTELHIADEEWKSKCTLLESALKDATQQAQSEREATVAAQEATKRAKDAANAMSDHASVLSATLNAERTKLQEVENAAALQQAELRVAQEKLHALADLQNRLQSMTRDYGNAMDELKESKHTTCRMEAELASMATHRGEIDQERAILSQEIKAKSTQVHDMDARMAEYDSKMQQMEAQLEQKLCDFEAVNAHNQEQWRTVTQAAQRLVEAVCDLQDASSRDNACAATDTPAMRHWLHRQHVRWGPGSNPTAVDPGAIVGALDNIRELCVGKGVLCRLAHDNAALRTQLQSADVQARAHEQTVAQLSADGDGMRSELARAQTACSVLERQLQESSRQVRMLQSDHAKLQTASDAAREKFEKESAAHSKKIDKLKTLQEGRLREFHHFTRQLLELSNHTGASPTTTHGARKATPPTTLHELLASIRAPHCGSWNRPHGTRTTRPSATPSQHASADWTARDLTWDDVRVCMESCVHTLGVNVRATVSQVLAAEQRCASLLEEMEQLNTRHGNAVSTISGIQHDSEQDYGLEISRLRSDREAAERELASQRAALSTAHSERQRAVDQLRAMTDECDRAHASAARVRHERDGFCMALLITARALAHARHVAAVRTCLAQASRQQSTRVASTVRVLLDQVNADALDAATASGGAPETLTEAGANVPSAPLPAAPPPANADCAVTYNARRRDRFRCAARVVVAAVRLRRQQKQVAEEWAHVSNDWTTHGPDGERRDMTLDAGVCPGVAGVSERQWSAVAELVDAMLTHYQAECQAPLTVSGAQWDGNTGTGAWTHDTARRRGLGHGGFAGAVVRALGVANPAGVFASGAGIAGGRCAVDDDVNALRTAYARVRRLWVAARNTLHEKHVSLATTVESLRESHAQATQNAAAATTATVDQYEQRLSSMQAELSSMVHRSRLAEAEAECETLRRTTASERQETSALVHIQGTALTEQKHEIDGLRHACASLHDEIKSLTARVTVEQQQREAVEAELQRTRDELEETSLRLTDLSRGLGEVDEYLEHSTNDYSSLSESHVRVTSHDRHVVGVARSPPAHGSRWASRADGSPSHIDNVSQRSTETKSSMSTVTPSTAGPSDASFSSQCNTSYRALPDRRPPMGSLAQSMLHLLQDEQENSS
eukprot:m.984403 g.984403  ORF g.984403 m.984403 type:complete len:1226 (-) comp23979_c0_seq3:414-4091(-)